MIMTYLLIYGQKVRNNIHPFYISSYLLNKQ